MDKQDNQSHEEQQRILAIERYEDGEAPQSISSSLGRSKSWFYKWLERRRNGTTQWYVEHSRRPLGCPTGPPKRSKRLSSWCD